MNDIFEEQVESAEEELKRADHLVYISLKYTRTGDVMQNAIKRIIAAYEWGFDDYLEFAKKKKIITEVSSAKKEKVLVLRSLLGGQIAKYIRSYNRLVKIDGAKTEATSEFRKGLTLTGLTKPQIVITVNDLIDYLELSKEFIALIRIRIGEKI